MYGVLVHFGCLHVMHFGRYYLKIFIVDKQLKMHGNAPVYPQTSRFHPSDLISYLSYLSVLASPSGSSLRRSLSKAWTIAPANRLPSARRIRPLTINPLDFSLSETSILIVTGISPFFSGDGAWNIPYPAAHIF